MSEQDEKSCDHLTSLTCSENEMDGMKGKKDVKGSRFAKTFQVFQEMGLLEYALQTAKLCKENEQLQQKIDLLEREVDQASRTARMNLKQHLMKLKQMPNMNPPEDVVSN